MNPAADESVKRVQGLMKDVLATTPGDVDQDLIESGLLDSMTLIELLYAIEEEFTVELPLEDLDVELLRSVRGIAAYVNKLRAD
jgi:acyl carrier protein